MLRIVGGWIGMFGGEFGGCGFYFFFSFSVFSFLGKEEVVWGVVLGRGLIEKFGSSFMLRREGVFLGYV